MRDQGATRRNAACSSAIRRNPAYSWALSRETASCPAMSLTASSRSVVNAPRMRRFSSSSTARSAPRLTTGTASTAQHSAAAKYGSRANRSSAAASATTSGSPVRCTYRSTEAGTGSSPPGPPAGMLPSPSGAATCQSCLQASHSARCTAVARVIAPSTSATRACSPPMLVGELSACDADTMPSRSIVPAVTAAPRPG